MTNEEILKMTASELGRKIKAGELTSEEVTRVYLDRISEEDKKYNAYISVCEEAVEEAKAIDAKIKAGELTGPFAGVPVAVKDNICTKGIATTCASKMLSNFVPPYDATVVKKLKEEGMVILGKTNMDEFAMGSTTETSFFGPTVNPHGTNKVPGGSSGGSAAYGLVAFASSLDQIGPIAKDAEDAAVLFNIISGVDERDQSSTVSEKIDIDAVTGFDVKGKKIGIPEEYFGEGIDADVKARVMEAVKFYEDHGASVETFKMPIIEYAIPTYYIIACAEACSNLSRYDGVKYGYRPEGVDNLIDLYIKSRSEGFGMEVKRRIMLGNFVLSSGYYDAYYNKALQAKALIKKAFDEAFAKYDVVIGPVAPTTALTAGESLSDPLKMYLGDICTVLINIVGLPAISVPCGNDSNGMPVGMQIIGKHYDEKTILGFASYYQRG